MSARTRQKQRQPAASAGAMAVASARDWDSRGIDCPDLHGLTEFSTTAEVASALARFGYDDHLDDGVRLLDTFGARKDSAVAAALDIVHGVRRPDDVERAGVEQVKPVEVRQWCGQSSL